jgi:hypothetical protein
MRVWWLPRGGAFGEILCDHGVVPTSEVRAQGSCDDYDSLNARASRAARPPAVQAAVCL